MDYLLLRGSKKNMAKDNKFHITHNAMMSLADAAVDLRVTNDINVKSINDVYNLYLENAKSEKSKTRRKLSVRARSITAGVDLPNYTHLDPVNVENYSKTWVTPYQKPVLTHHDRTSDPIGKVVEYSVEKGGDGVGINVMLNILDENAIDKFLDQRFFTLSATYAPTKITCSVCNGDPMKGTCEHYRGQSVYVDADGQEVANEDEAVGTKTVSWIVNDLEFVELSVVNVPNDNRAVVKEASLVENSNELITNNDEYIDSLLNPEKISNVNVDMFVINSDDTEEEIANATYSVENEKETGIVFTDEEKEKLTEMNTKLSEAVEMLFPNSVISEDEIKNLPESQFCVKPDILPIANKEYAAAARYIIKNSELEDELRVKLENALNEIKFEEPETKTEENSESVEEEESKSEDIVNAQKRIEELENALDSAMKEKEELQEKFDSLKVDELKQENSDLANKCSTLENDISIYAKSILDIKNSAISSIKRSIAVMQLSNGMSDDEFSPKSVEDVENAITTVVEGLTGTFRSIIKLNNDAMSTVIANMVPAEDPKPVHEQLENNAQLSPDKNSIRVDPEAERYRMAIADLWSSGK